MPRVGVLSDTHGLLRPEAKAFLSGSDLILHAGDIGRAAILAELAQIAPVTAVRGNNDRGAWAETLPEIKALLVDEVQIVLLHDIADLRATGRAPDARVVVTGHSHKPALREADGVLYLNPGSAGPRRFKLPISVAELIVSGGSVTARLVELPAPRSR